MRKVAIIGAGAAGMTAAITAASNGAEVVVLEHMDRVGKKILSTGKLLSFLLHCLLCGE